MIRFDPRSIFQRWYDRFARKRRPPLASGRGLPPPPVRVLAGAGPALQRLQVTWVPERWVALQARSKEALIAPPVDPRLREFAEAFISDAWKRGIPLFVSEGVRSPERQDHLKTLGFSKNSSLTGKHVKGRAVDIVHGVKAWGLKKDEWLILAQIGKEVIRKRNLRMRWGGDFVSFYDPAHWELLDEK